MNKTPLTNPSYSAVPFIPYPKCTVNFNQALGETLKPDGSAGFQLQQDQDFKFHLGIYSAEHH